MSGSPNQGQGTSATGLSFPAALALTPAAGVLVADRANNRVVFFDSVPATSGAAAHAVLGQPNPQASSSALTQAGMSGPLGVAVGAGRMAVADSAAHRVLVYAQLPVASQPMPQPAVVIGQPDFVTGLPPACAGNRLNSPTAVAITPAGRLIVVDGGNHRVLVWNQVPAADPVAPPDLVLGQSRLDRCVRNNNDQNGDVAARGSLSSPADVWSNDDRLVVADAGNNRVLIWRHFPAGNLQDADVVLGHADATSSAPNDGGAVPGASTLHDPEGVHSDGTALAVADAQNNRVLIWRTFPASDAQAAEVVLGHQLFNQRLSNDGDNDGVSDGPTGQVLNYPIRLLLTPDSLFVTDLGHSRVLRFGR